MIQILKLSCLHFGGRDEIFSWKQTNYAKKMGEVIYSFKRKKGEGGTGRMIMVCFSWKWRKFCVKVPIKVGLGSGLPVRACQWFEFYSAAAAPAAQLKIFTKGILNWIALVCFMSLVNFFESLGKIYDQISIYDTNNLLSGRQSILLISEIENLKEEIILYSQLMYVSCARLP